MNFRKLITRFSTTLLCAALSHSAIADVLELTEKDDWINLVGEFTTIDFTGFEDGTFITDQYAHQGVIFEDGNDNIFINEGFLNDGAGLDGNEAIDIVFDTPQTYIATDFPGSLQIELYDGDRLLSTSIFNGGGLGFFFGLISTEPFNALVLVRPFKGSQVFIDDLHFGYGIPGDVNHDDSVGIEDLLIILNGYGPCPEQVDPCPGDIDSNNVVGISDLFLLLDNWGPCDDCDKPDGCFADTDDNCIVGTSDLLIILGSFGSCPPPNYIICPEDITFDGTVDTSDILLVLNNWG